MDNVKIGKFISETRKNLGLTQLQLAEKLSISDRAVSKWERGKGLPDVSIMLPLCKILQINVNDLLSGEILNEQNYPEKSEDNMIEVLSKSKKLVRILIIFLMSVLYVISLLVSFIVCNRYTSNEYFHYSEQLNGFIDYELKNLSENKESLSDFKEDLEAECGNEEFLLSAIVLDANGNEIINSAKTENYDYGPECRRIIEENKNNRVGYPTAFTSADCIEYYNSVEYQDTVLRVGAFSTRNQLTETFKSEMFLFCLLVLSCSYLLILFAAIVCFRLEKIHIKDKQRTHF